MPHRRVPNTDPPAGSMPPADTGVLRERVYNLERSVTTTQQELHEIRSVMATGEDIRSVQAGIAAISADVKQQLAAITGEMKNYGKPQWQAIGVGVTVLALMGGILYWPIRDKQGDHQDRLSRIEQNYVPERVHQREWDQRDKALKELRDRTEDNTKELVPREVFTQRTDELSRQIAEISRRQGDVYTARDVILDLRNEVRQLKERVYNSAPSRP